MTREDTVNSEINKSELRLNKTKQAIVAIINNTRGRQYYKDQI